jgi:hypothetical protein
MMVAGVGVSGDTQEYSVRNVELMSACPKMAAGAVVDDVVVVVEDNGAADVMMVAAVAVAVVVVEAREKSVQRDFENRLEVAERFDGDAAYFEASLCVFALQRVFCMRSYGEKRSCCDDAARWEWKEHKQMKTLRWVANEVFVVCFFFFVVVVVFVQICALCSAKKYLK